MLARRNAHVRLKFRRIAALTIGLMLMLLLPQRSSAVVIFVVFEGGYGPLARLVAAQDELPITRLHEGILFDVPTAADDAQARQALLYRPGWARWNVYAEVSLRAQDLEDDFYVIGSDMASMVTLSRDITQSDAARRQRDRNRRQLLDAWALLTVTNQWPMLYIDSLDVYAEAIESLDPMLRGMATFSHIRPVLRIRPSIYHASLAVLPPFPHLRLVTMQWDLPREVLHFAAALYQRDQAMVAGIPMSRPAIPLPINSAAGRIVALIVDYMVGERPVLMAPNAGNFIAIFEALMTPLRPLWRAQWRRPVFLYRDPAVSLRRQEDQAQAWGLNLLPGSVGRRARRPIAAQLGSVD